MSEEIKQTLSSISKKFANETKSFITEQWKIESAKTFLGEMTKFSHYPRQTDELNIACCNAIFEFHDVIRFG